jgi:hypothetical protein
VALAWCPSVANAFGAEHRQLPRVGSLIVPNQVRIAVGAFEFEVAVVWRQPRVDHGGDLNATVSENQRAWRLLAAMTRIALHTNIQEPFIVHLITMLIFGTISLPARER